MRTVSVTEAKTQWVQLLQAVARGESITITRRGKPVAVLGPTPKVEPIDRAKVVEAIERIKELRKGTTLGPDLTIRQLIDEGRKY